MIPIYKTDLERENRDKGTDLKTMLTSEATDEEVSIELLIRERYSTSQELAMHRKKLMGIEDTAEWNEYCAYVQECIDRVRNAEQE